MASSKVVIGIFSSYDEAAQAVDQLKREDFPEKEISLIGRDTDDMRPVTSHLVDTRDPDKMLTNLGIAGAVGGLLVGLASVAIPGTGALVVAGPLLAAISGAAAGGALGVVAGALVHFDVPESEARVYEAHLTAGKVLVAVHTDSPEARFKAEEIMDRFGALEVDTKAA